jgi:glutamine amidotransferase
MCRLFALSAGGAPVRATFWLLDAPDSLSQQSRRDPDGTGLGYFDARGEAHVDKQPLAAYRDRAFAREARSVSSPTFLAHVRYASTGAVSPANTHPFLQDGRLFAHNGVVGDLQRLEQRLGATRALVVGESDSERVFALITQEARERSGDVQAAIVAAARWVAAELPLYALNLIVATASDLWALRYPDTHELYVLRRSAGGQRGSEPLEHRGHPAETHVRSDELATRDAAVIASERMDDDPDWHALRSGELLHVGPGLKTETTVALEEPPAHPLTLADLGDRERASQAPSG